MKIGERIRKLREEKGFSQSALARLSDISNDYMHKIESGKVSNIGIEVIDSIAKALTIEPTLILYGKSLHSNKKKEEEIISDDFSHEFVEVPLLKGSVSAGAFEQSFEDWDGETFAVPKGMFKGKNLVAWKVKGKSMEPVYMEGDHLIINKDFDCVDEMDVIVKRNGDEVTVKKIKIFKNGIIELRPYNPDYPTIQVKSCDEIIGKVVGYFRKK